MMPFALQDKKIVSLSSSANGTQGILICCETYHVIISSSYTAISQPVVIFYKKFQTFSVICNLILQSKTNDFLSERRVLFVLKDYITGSKGSIIISILLKCI